MNAAGVLALPQNIADMRLQVVERVATLFEQQSRSQHYVSLLKQLVVSIHHDTGKALEDAAAAIANSSLSPADREKVMPAIAQAQRQCQNLDAALPLLTQSRHISWRQGKENLQSILLRFDETTQRLAGTLIEKELLERQSAVLEKIILSHEKVAQWKSFVQEILASFHAIFPFEFFFIAFVEEHGLAMNLYYSGQFDAASKDLARTKLAKEMVRQLKLPHDALLDVEEFDIAVEARQDVPGDVDLITVAVPELETVNLAGLLGIAYASSRKPTAQEVAVIRSILSVMVMVVGSSKALGRTLMELEYYSAHDPLTGLYNRRYFGDMLTYEVGRSERHGHEFSLLMLDLDNFKDVNDTWGHPCGDAALCRIAELLHEVTRKGDVAARMGGDEFVIMLTETGIEGARVVAEKIRVLLRETRFFAPDGKPFHVTVSIGVASYPKDAQNVSDLMAGVDVGLYRAKELGKDGVSTLEMVSGRLLENRVTRDMAERLRSALGEKRLRPYFQPIYDCRTGELFAYETLARLIEPNGETLPAGAFIETIEKYGMGRELDRAIIAHALQAMRARLDEGKEPVRLFINLSAQEIQGRSIIAFAERLCEELSIPANMIVFEILERDAIGDMTHMRTFLSKLRAKGFLFALDDFGSGYNSFHYLRELHFDFVKIDGSFVRNILVSKTDRALVHNLANLCRDLGINAVGEFVESQELMDAIRGMGIEYAQGFHLGMPSARML